MEGRCLPFCSGCLPSVGHWSLCARCLSLVAQPLGHSAAATRLPPGSQDGGVGAVPPAPQTGLLQMWESHSGDSMFRLQWVALGSGVTLVSGTQRGVL